MGAVLRCYYYFCNCINYAKIDYISLWVGYFYFYYRKFLLFLLYYFYYYSPTLLLIVLLSSYKLYIILPLL